METSEQVKWNPNPEGKGGFQDHPELINRDGRPKNSLKGYVAKKLAAMSDEEKEAFIKDISKAEVWKMGEGLPHKTHDITSKGEKLTPLLVKIIDDKDDEDTNGV